MMRKRTLKAIGYWYGERTPDIPHPKDLPTCQYESEEKAKILAYLKAGKPYESWMGFSCCRYGCDFPVNQMGSKDLTDGTWLWPEGLWHYVDCHNFRLPDEFVETIKQNDWMIQMKNIPYMTRIAMGSDECIIDYSWWITWSADKKSKRWSSE